MREDGIWWRGQRPVWTPPLLSASLVPNSPVSDIKYSQFQFLLLLHSCFPSNPSPCAIRIISPDLTPWRVPSGYSILGYFFSGHSDPVGSELVSIAHIQNRCFVQTQNASSVALDVDTSNSRLETFHRQGVNQWFSTWAISPTVSDRAAQGGDRGERSSSDQKYRCIFVPDLWDSVRPEFGRQNQPRGNSSTHSSYAPIH